MGGSKWFLFLLVICLIANRDAAQNATRQDSDPPEQDERRSFYLGTPVSKPEELSGLWEAADGHGGAVGIHLVLSTTAPTDTSRLDGINQSWLSLGVGI